MRLFRNSMYVTLMLFVWVSLGSGQIIFQDHFDDISSINNWHHTTDYRGGGQFEIVNGQFERTQVGHVFYYNDSFKSGTATYEFKARGHWVFIWRGTTEDPASGKALAIVSDNGNLLYLECDWWGFVYGYHNNSRPRMESVSVGQFLNDSLNSIKIVDDSTTAKIYVNNQLQFDLTISPDYRNYGYIEIGCNHQSDPATFDDIIVTGTSQIPRNIVGTVSANDAGLAGVTVKLLDADGLPVAGRDPITTDANGEYAFPNLVPADYQVMIVEPLGYAVDGNPKPVQLVSGTTERVNFLLSASVLRNAAREKGYWKHQFDVYVTGRGNAQETEAQLSSYISSVPVFYGPHFSIFSDLQSFTDWQSVLSSAKSAPMIEKAKEHLAALVLNLASFKIGQYTVVTADGRTAGDVLTYVSTLVDDGISTNDELAKNLAEKVNAQLTITAGVVPSTGILYKVSRSTDSSSGEMPKEYMLSQNYPNPFNPVTTIRYAIPTPGHVSLKVYSVLGQEVATLVEAINEAGFKSVTFNASALTSGVYYYRLRSANNVVTRKMLLVQ